MNRPGVLVVGPNWIGDMVMAQALFQRLRAHQPDVWLSVMAPPWTSPLLGRMPQVDEALEAPFPRGHLALGARWRMARTLRARGFTQAIILPNSLKSALVPWLARIPRRTGWRGEWRYGLLNDLRRLDPARWPLMVQRFAALADDPDAPPPDPASLPSPNLIASPEGAQAALTRLGLTQDGRPLLALCPGAEYGEAKRWPSEHYAAVARLWVQRGGQVWIFGSARDRAVASAILARVPEGGVDLCGRTSLGEAIDLLALAHAVVSNDSGLMHLAAALDRPLVALFGSTDPGFTPPRSPRARVLRLGLACSPCFARVCRFGHRHCLTGITPEQVDAALQEGLA